MAKVITRPLLNLKHETILKKKFAVELSGYNAGEVDGFLDLVIKDYQLYDQHIATLQDIVSEKVALVNDKDEQLDKLKIENANLKEQLDFLYKNSTNQVLHKRLSKLEKELGK
ncbi:DivIVA domain-containing protein [Mycoplasma sp. ATU-Cv-703]|uniref:DivIVA domain-containing protein n=2 Tax=unclassified Mycoplasma TaxID=2683645 RepID=UPI000FDDBDA2